MRAPEPCGGGTQGGGGATVVVYDRDNMLSGASTTLAHMGFENGKLVRVVMAATKSGDSQVNVLHYDLEDSPGSDDNDPQSLANYFRDHVVAPFRALYDSSWTIKPVVVEEEKDPQNPTAPRGAWIAGADVPGTSSAASELLPRACTVVVSLRSAHIGRRFTGRMFISGITNEAKQNNGVWDPGWLTGLVQPYLDAIPHQPDISPPLSVATAKWCIYSRTQRAADADPYASAVTSYVMRQDVHWLRSRQTF